MSLSPRTLLKNFAFFLTFNRISAASKLSFERFILTSKTECSNLLLQKMFTVLMLKKACFARTCFRIRTIQLAIKKIYTTVVYSHMTLSCFFQRRYISGITQNIYCCAYFRLLSAHLRLLQDLLSILEKVVRGIPLPRYWIILNQI